MQRSQKIQLCSQILGIVLQRDRGVDGLLYLREQEKEKVKADVFGRTKKRGDTKRD